jgi:hypothetical protein
MSKLKAGVHFVPAQLFSSPGISRTSALPARHAGIVIVPWRCTGRIFQNEQALGQAGDNLLYRYPKKLLLEMKKAKTPKEWSLESREIAVEKAYLRGELKGGTSKETAVELPEGYSKAAKVVAERQAALAGYRLADEIGKWVR